MKKLDVPLTSISEVKRSPMNIFQKANQEGAGVYVFNREKVVGVMVTREQYESLLGEIDQLSDQLVNLVAEKRLLKKNGPFFSDVAVRGLKATEPPVIDEEDGWE